MADDANADGALAEFTMITGANADEARHYIDAAGGDLSAALNIYFQTGGGASSGASNSPTVNGSNSTGATSAERMNDAAASQSSSSTAVAGIGEDDEVRQPMQPTSGVLVKHSYGVAYAAPRRAVTNSVFDHMRDFKAESAAQFARAVARGQQLHNQNGHHDTVRASTSQTSTAADSKDPTKVVDLTDEDDGDDQNKKRTLASLFRPPVDLITTGVFEEVRERACKRNLWLLVNIQNVEEFQSQVLNRDVWSNETVQDVIRQNFLFWQVYSDSVDGQRFITYYHVMSQPHVSVIDPRTGEQVLTVTVGDAVSCADALTTFLDLYPSPNAETSGSHRTRAPVVNNGVADETTDAASDASGSRKRTRPQQEEDVDENETSAAAPEAEPRATASDAITVMIRHPDGRRAELCVKDSTPVQSVLTWLCGEQDLCTDNCDFIVTFPKRVLNEYPGETSLREIKLGRKEMIHVDKRS